MAIYDKQSPEIAANTYKTTFKLKNVNLYGSSRIGTYNSDKILSEREFTAGIDPTTRAFINIVQTSLNMFNGNSTILSRTLGNKQFELANHLGNVVATVSDMRFPINSLGSVLGYEADVKSANLYYPFGMIQSNPLNIDAAGYRYGFNGKESDNEVSGNRNSYDYGFRIYSPRIAKFLSVDPLTKSYPMLTPYQFASNTPIHSIDLDGLESATYELRIWKDAEGKVLTSVQSSEGNFNATNKGIQYIIHNNITSEESEYWVNEVVFEYVPSYSENVTKAVSDFGGFVADIPNQMEKTQRSLMGVNGMRKSGGGIEKFGEGVMLAGIASSGSGFGAALIPIGEGISLFGVGLQIGADVSEKKYGDAATKAAIEFVPGVLSKPLKKVVDKYFDKAAQQAVDNSSKQAVEQGRNVVKAQIKLGEFSTEQAIENKVED